MYKANDGGAKWATYLRILATYNDYVTVIFFGFSVAFEFSRIFRPTETHGPQGFVIVFRKDASRILIRPRRHFIMQNDDDKATGALSTFPCPWEIGVFESFAFCPKNLINHSFLYNFFE